LAGVTADRVTVIYGERSIPSLEVDDAKVVQDQNIEELQQLNEDANGLYKRLAVNPVAQRIRSLFCQQKAGRTIKLYLPYVPLSMLTREIQLNFMHSNGWTY
jgi:hypothetical protein